MPILLIEDDPLWENAIVEELEEAGYQVEVADTFEKARAMLNLGGEQTECKQSEFDLLIVDIRLPADHEGLKILEELQTRQSEAGISVEEQPRVIISSVLNHVAVSDWEDRARSDMFLVKPYDLSALVKGVRSLLEPKTDGDSSNEN